VDRRALIAVVAAGADGSLIFAVDADHAATVSFDPATHLPRTIATTTPDLTAVQTIERWRDAGGVKAALVPARHRQLRLDDREAHSRVARHHVAEVTFVPRHARLPRPQAVARSAVGTSPARIAAGKSCRRTIA